MQDLRYMSQRLAVDGPHEIGRRPAAGSLRSDNHFERAGSLKVNRRPKSGWTELPLAVLMASPEPMEFWESGSSRVRCERGQFGAVDHRFTRHQLGSAQIINDGDASAGCRRNRANGPGACAYRAFRNDRPNTIGLGAIVLVLTALPGGVRPAIAEETEQFARAGLSVAVVENAPSGWT